MKIIFKLLCAVALGLSANAYCENTSEGALEFVQSARLDFVIFDAFKYSTLKNLPDTQARDEMAQCLTANGYREFAPILALHIANGMIESEINEQVHFYNTPIGKKFVEATLISAHHDHQFDQNIQTPKFSEKEKLLIKSYLKLTTSTKLGNVLTSPSVGIEIKAIGAKIIDKCKSK